jgi:hypothetical protein
MLAVHETEVIPFLRTWMDPRGRQRKLRKSSLSNLARLTLRPDQGSTLIYASFVKGPHESSST